MNQPVERRFLATVSEYLVSLPFDLKVLFEAKDDPDLDRKARETACGAILYVLTKTDVAPGLSVERVVRHGPDLVINIARVSPGSRFSLRPVLAHDRIADPTLDREPVIAERQLCRQRQCCRAAHCGAHVPHVIRFLLNRELDVGARHSRR